MFDGERSACIEPGQAEQTLSRGFYSFIDLRVMFETNFELKGNLVFLWAFFNLIWPCQLFT